MPGFVIGWIDWVSITASGALKAVVMVEYLVRLLPGLEAHSIILAMLITSVFAALQLLGVRAAGAIHQVAIAFVGVFMIGLAIALFLGAGQAPPPAAADSGFPGGQFGLVIAAIVFTYDGWTGPSYFAGEIRGDGGELARGAFRGMLIVIAIYLLLNLGLVASVGIASLQDSKLALGSAIELLYGTATPIVLVAIFILLMHQNLQYMWTSRTLYALSVDGLGTRYATGVSSRGTPAMAVMFTWLLTLLLITINKFEVLLGMTAMMFMLLYIALVIGVFRLRKQEPDTPRPYRAWGFPLTGYICTIGWVILAILVGIDEPDSTRQGLALIAVSIPAYLALKRYRRR